MSGVLQLGYLVFEVSDLAAWKDFGTKILGLGLVGGKGDKGEEGFGLRMDGHFQRFFIESGPADDLAAVGWEVDGPTALEEIVGRLKAAGHEVVQGTAEDVARRNVDALVRFEDPAGNPCELYYGPKMADAPFVSVVVRSGFVADEQGLGHVVVVSKNAEEQEAFYATMLGLKLSDYIRCEYFGHKIDVTFMHANPRHHSFAFGEGRHKRIHHFMVQARAMDEVGLCYDRFLFSGGMVHQTLGRHPNDKMFSFYGYTPSGFHFEFGYGGVEIDDETWETTTHDRVSEWGHHPPQLLTKAYHKAKQEREKKNQR
ncbi:MAG: VOC family protein [Deltaproteobacteria bacterium]|nr:VOC family protein [Deltaproteobacteria bacterium]